MPTINLSPKVRFGLYLVGALASLFVVYAVDKSWAGDAEVRLVSGIVALISLLAAANTNTSGDEVVKLKDAQGGLDPERVGQAIGSAINEAASRANRRTDGGH